MSYLASCLVQIDPFGHSAAQAALLSAETGFDALYFARIDWQEASHRISQREMEMLWRASPSLGADAEVEFLLMFHPEPFRLCATRSISLWLPLRTWCGGYARYAHGAAAVTHMVHHT